MHPPSDTTLLAEGPFPPEALDILWQPDVPLSPHAQSHIDARWTDYLAQAQAHNHSLFNAPIARLVDVRRIDRRISLTLAPSDYKTFFVTVLRDRPWFLQHAPSALRPALGNSVLLTHGHRALLGIRSPRTSAYPHRAHLIGGVLEPLGTAGLPAGVPGILTHLRREMFEEAGIVDHELRGNPSLLAVARDEFLAQPELVWHWELAVEPHDIAQRLHADEHEGSIFIEKDHLESLTFDRMTPLARLAWERWRAMPPVF